MAQVGIGLDIGTRSIRLAQMRRNRQGQLHLARYACGPTPLGSVESGVVVDTVAVSETLKSLAKKAGIRRSPVVASVYGQGTVVRQLKLPPMSVDELTQAVYWEAESQLPFAIEEAAMDFAVLEPADDQGELSVIFVAVPKHTVNQLIQAVEDAGFYLQAIDLQPFALARSLSEGHSQETVTVIDFGASKTGIVILKQGRICFTRQAAIGSDSITRIISQEMDLEFEAAEERKVRYSSVGVGEEGPLSESADEAPVSVGLDNNGSRPGRNGEPEQRAAESVYAELVDEVRRSLDYHRVQTQWEDTVNKIVLTGGGARLRGLRQALQRDLGLTVVLHDPVLSGLVLSTANRGETDEVDAAASVAVGLAMRDVTDL